MLWPACAGLFLACTDYQTHLITIQVFKAVNILQYVSSFVMLSW